MFLVALFWRRQWHPTPVLLPGKSHVWKSLEGCSPWGPWGSETTKWLHFHFSLSCIGGGNGNPLQCSCLENPSDGGAWWAAVYGVARTRLKWLRSSSSRGFIYKCPKLESTWISLNWGMDKQTVVHLHNGILVRNKSEQINDTCNNIDESQMLTLVERSQIWKATYCVIPFI